MKLTPYLAAWALTLFTALGARISMPSASGALAGAYALVSGVVLLTVIRYRFRLDGYLRHEHRALWSSLKPVRGSLVPSRRLLGWLLAPGVPPAGDLRAARTTGGWVGVIIVVWLISTPSICLVLALRTT